MNIKSHDHPKHTVICTCTVYLCNSTNTCVGVLLSVENPLSVFIAGHC